MKKLLLIILVIFIIFSCSQKENQIQMAKEHIEKIGKNPTAKDISDMFYTAKIYYGNNPEVAIIYFEKVVNYKPESLKYLTDYYLKKKDYRNFEKWAKIAAEKGINDVTYNLAYYYETNGKIQEAIEYYMIAAKNGDKSSENNVVNLYVKRGNDEETKKILNISSLNLKNPEKYINKNGERLRLTKLNQDLFGEIFNTSISYESEKLKKLIVISYLILILILVSEIFIKSFKINSIFYYSIYLFSILYFPILLLRNKENLKGIVLINSLYLVTQLIYLAIVFLWLYIKF